MSFVFFDVSPTFAENMNSILGESVVAELTAVDEKSENTITLYEYDQENDKLNEETYILDIKGKEFGDKAHAADTRYYKWSTDEKGNYILTDGNFDDYDVVYYVSSEKEYIKDASGVFQNTGTTESFSKGILDLTSDVNKTIITNVKDTEITSITGDYVNNISNISLISNPKDAEIGSIYLTAIKNNVKNVISNSSNISSIKGVYIDNNTTGSLISNTGKIDSIEGVFIGNNGPNRGGAIYNSGTIGSIKGVFINNYASSEGSAIW